MPSKPDWRAILGGQQADVLSLLAVPASSIDFEKSVISVSESSPSKEILTRQSRPSNNKTPVFNPQGGADTNDETSPRGASAPSKASERQITDSSWILNLCGARLIGSGDAITIGIWQDLDVRELRVAIACLGLDGLRMVYLESAEAPFEYKVRTCPDRAKGQTFASWLKHAKAEHRRRFDPSSEAA